MFLSQAWSAPKCMKMLRFGIVITVGSGALDDIPDSDTDADSDPGVRDPLSRFSEQACERQAGAAYPICRHSRASRCIRRSALRGPQEPAE